MLCSFKVSYTYTYACNIQEAKCFEFTVQILQFLQMLYRFKYQNKEIDGVERRRLNKG